MGAVKYCVVAECAGLYYARDMCAKHYKRLWKKGTLHLDRIVGNDVDRFWSKVNKTNNCWLWLGTQNGLGYGSFSQGSKRVAAHRFSYELHVGKIPEGLHLDHVVSRGCKSTLCVNPKHLEPVTNRENGIRGKRVTEKKSGLPLGVSHKRDKFRSSVMVKGVHYYLGTFNTALEAHKAYKAALSDKSGSAWGA